jgi:hypothetical protein
LSELYIIYGFLFIKFIINKGFPLSVCTTSLDLLLPMTAGKNPRNFKKKG